MRKPLWVAALLVLTGLAHLPGLQNDFVLWDDDTHITQNPVIRALTAENVAAMFTQPIAKLYCPLTWLSFAVDYRLWGRDPFGYHLTNLLLHLANTVLVFLLLDRLRPLWERPFLLVEHPLSLWERPSGRDSSVAGNSIPLLTAALFGVHPLRVESVAWATERKDVLFVFFYLLALLVYLQRDRLWLCFLLFVAATLSKSAAVTFPVVALLLDRFLGQPLRWKPLIPFFAVSLLIGGVTIWVQTQGSGETVASPDAIPLAIRPALVGYCALFYVGKFLWPFHLSAIYPTFDEMRWSPALALVGFGAVTTGVWLRRRRVPAVLAGWLFYLVTLAPTIGLAPVGIHVVADRYAYLPMLGLAFAAVTALGRFRPFLWVAVIALAYLSFLRTSVWRDTERLFLSVLDDNPRSLPAHINLTKWYTTLGEHDRAIEHGRQAVAIAPAGAPGRRNLAAALKAAGRLDEAVTVWPGIAAPRSADVPD